MNILNDFFNKNNLSDNNDIEALIQVADILRNLIIQKEYNNISNLIKYVISKDYKEAISWIIGILQEEFEKEENKNSIKDFSCDIEKSLHNYNAFVGYLGVDFNSIDNEVKTIYDCNGEIESFYNIMVYKTKYKNIFLISSENFDTKDNDYIQYKLLFTRNPQKYQEVKKEFDDKEK